MKKRINGNAKGKAGEREAAELLRAYGFEARRGQQFSGGGDSPDVVHNIPGIHVEVKRTETLSIYKAMEQAETDASGKMPMVLHRRNGKPWLAVFRAQEILMLLKQLKTFTDSETGDGLDR